MDPAPPPRLLLTMDEAAVALGGLSKAGVYRLIRQGRLKKVKVGSRTFISTAELERYVASLEDE